MRSFKYALPAALIGLAVASPARADDGQGDLDGLLGQSVVTGASRAAETASDAPAVSTSASADDLRKYGIRSVDEALNYLTLGMWASDPYRFSEVGSRGVALASDFNHHVLVVVDGMPINEQFLGGVFFGKILGLPLDQIDHIEVILGPGSVLYGSQAMLGVINIATKSGKDWRGVHATVDFAVSPQENVNNDPYLSNFDHLGLSRRVDVGAGWTGKVFGKDAQLALGAGWLASSGPSLTFALQKALPPANPLITFGSQTPGNTWGGEVDNANARTALGVHARYSIGEFSGSVRAMRGQFNHPFYDNIFQGAFDDPHSQSVFQNASMDNRWDRTLNEHMSAMVRLYGAISNFDRTDYEVSHPQCPLGPVGPCDRHLRGNSAWLGLELQGNYDWKADGAYTTMYGVDGRVREVSGGEEDIDVFTGKSFGTAGRVDLIQQALGAYVQQRARFTKWAALNAGIRADFDTVTPKPSLFKGISPRLALVASPTDTTNVRAIFSSAFRSPSALELNLADDRLVPPPNGLGPEHVTDYELVVDQRIGTLQMLVGGFYSLWEDMIQLQVIGITATGAQLQYQNTSKITNYGGNASVSGTALDGKLQFGVNVTVAKATVAAKTGDQPLTQSPNLLGNARVAYQFGSELPTLALAAAFLGPRLADGAYIAGEQSNLTPRPEAPTQVSLRGTLSGPIGGLKGVSYRVGGEYVFGKWSPYVVGINQGAPQSIISAPTAAALLPINRVTLFASITVDVLP
jgi:outer membrane receptor for ferrienterochelin and colicins